MPTLTEKHIEAAEAPEKGQRIIYDDHKNAPKGFGLRVLASGSKSFILRYKAGGRDRRLTIGEWGTWTLAAARKQAGEFKREVDGGTDILEQRRADRREPLVSEVLGRFCAAHVDKLASARAVRALLERYLVPAIGKRRIRDVRRRDVIAMVEDVAGKHGRTAALLLTHTKLLFAWAEDRELIEANPAATIKPGKISKTMAPRNRARVLSAGEIKSFWTHAETCGLHRLSALCLKFILVTGQRPGECAGMRLEEVQGKVWTIPASRRGKTNTSHTVPLTDTALEILEQAKAEAKRLEKRRKRAGGYVFEARPETPVTTAALGRAVNRYADTLGNLEAPEGGYWTPHDLRRSCRTGLAAAGVHEIVAEAVIGHTRKGIAAVYDLHRYDAEKRAALEAWERRLIRIVAGKKPEDSKVVSIAEARA